MAHWLGVKEYLSQGEGFHDLPAAHVILWDRYMAYAAAMGRQRAAARALPLGAEDDHKAWSDYTGTWRQVTVRYPRRRFLWGRSSSQRLVHWPVLRWLRRRQASTGLLRCSTTADGLPSFG